MNQKYSSAETSINTINAVYKSTEFSDGDLVLDYGAGKYNSNRDYFLKKYPNGKFLKYDKYNCSKQENMESLQHCSVNTPNWIICSNVLNVIAEDEIISEIVNDISALSDANTNVIFAIYEGNRSGNGKETSKGYQRNQKASQYVELVSDKFDVKRKGSLLHCKKKRG